MPEIIQKAKCDYCGKLYAKWNSAVKHEKECYYNPAMRACCTCANMVAGEFEDHYLSGGEDRVMIVFTKQCWEDHDLQQLDYDVHMERCLQNNCEFWELRTAIGTVKFGRTKIEKV
jgi:hypothetical protein